MLQLNPYGNNKMSVVKTFQNYREFSVDYISTSYII